jgi:hypothetical protein
MKIRTWTTPSRWTAFAMLVLMCLSAACSHSDPFSNPQGTDTPFDPSPPVRLTLSDGHDGHPAWIADGNGILYSASQPTREDGDVCLAELPPGGGSQRRLVCNLPGDRTTRDAAQSPAAGPDGSLAFLSAGNGGLAGTSPVFTDIAVSSSLDASKTQMVRHLPFTPAGGVPQDYAGYLRWLAPARLAYVGQQFRLFRPCGSILCPYDTLLYGTDVTVLDLSGGGAATVTIVPGTAQATGVASTDEGTAILFTIPNDTRIYRRGLHDGEAVVYHDFGAAGIVRDVHASGGRVAAVVGGRVAFSVHPQLGPTQWDSGGAIHVLGPEPDDEVVLETPERLYRRPALSPDGTRVVAEGFPLIIVALPVGGLDTTVAKRADLYLFGGE